MSKKPKQMDKHPLQTSILVNKNRSFVLYYSNYSMRKVFLKQLLKLFPFILHVCNSKVIFQGIFQERRIFFFSNQILKSNKTFLSELRKTLKHE